MSSLSEEDREDIAAAALLKLVAVPIQMIDGRGMGAYVRTVINNAAREELRCIQRRRKSIFLLDDTKDCDENDPTVDLTDPRQDLERSVLDADTLQRYLDSLTEYEYQIVTLLLGSEEHPPMTMLNIAKVLKIKQQEVERVLDGTYQRYREQHRMTNVHDDTSASQPTR